MLGHWVTKTKSNPRCRWVDIALMRGSVDSPGYFDKAIIDEGAQVSVAQALTALLLDKKIILLGGVCMPCKGRQYHAVAEIHVIGQRPLDLGCTSSI